jgi:hypothetical protein
MLLFCFIASFFVLIVSLSLQWLVYRDWLREGGPLRLVGSVLAALLTFAWILRWQLSVRNRHREMVRRFETIARMNDRIRNALQVIECATYASSPNATEPVRSAVDTIDGVLREVLADTVPAPAPVEKAERTHGVAVQKR